MDMSHQERLELQVEYVEKSKPPTPNIERLQTAKEDFAARYHPEQIN
jgi:hypothetical protein